MLHTCINVKVVIYFIRNSVVCHVIYLPTCTEEYIFFLHTFTYYFLKKFEKCLTMNYYVDLCICIPTHNKHYAIT